MVTATSFFFFFFIILRRINKYANFDDVLLIIVKSYLCLVLVHVFVLFEIVWMLCWNNWTDLDNLFGKCWMFCIVKCNRHPSSWSSLVAISLYAILNWCWNIVSFVVSYPVLVHTKCLIYCTKSNQNHSISGDARCLLDVLYILKISHFLADWRDFSVKMCWTILWLFKICLHPIASRFQKISFVDFHYFNHYSVCFFLCFALLLVLRC